MGEGPEKCIIRIEPARYSGWLPGFRRAGGPELRKTPRQSTDQIFGHGVPYESSLRIFQFDVDLLKKQFAKFTGNSGYSYGIYRMLSGTLAIHLKRSKLLRRVEKFKENFRMATHAQRFDLSGGFPLILARRRDPDCHLQYPLECNCYRAKR